VCDRLVILHRGRARVAGGVDEILTRGDEVRFTAKGLGDDDAKEIARLIEERASESRTDKPRDTLETVFLRQVKGEDAPE